ncbi:hypothetical protein EJ110_NYTH45223 [Nymphaea thermarum]|nr:hypothetical protein EJ110_NYTH45223 [Nymphaea thermarum]
MPGVSTRDPFLAQPPSAERLSPPSAEMLKEVEKEVEDRNKKFTWSNHRQGQDSVQCKLDWCLINDEWTTSFGREGSLQVQTLPPQAGRFKKDVWRNCIDNFSSIKWNTEDDTKLRIWLETGLNTVNTIGSNSEGMLINIVSASTRQGPKIAGLSYSDDGQMGCAVIINARGRMHEGERAVLERILRFHKDYGGVYVIVSPIKEWKYVFGMLTNFGSMTLDRIHNTLKVPIILESQSSSIFSPRALRWSVKASQGKRWALPRWWADGRVFAEGGNGWRLFELGLHRWRQLCLRMVVARWWRPLRVRQMLKQGMQASMMVRVNQQGAVPRRSQGRIRKELAWWSRWQLGDVASHITGLKRELEHIQFGAAAGEPHLATLEHMLRQDSKVYLEEENKLRQKSRIKWLQASDKNTAFFQQMV